MCYDWIRLLFLSLVVIISNLHLVLSKVMLTDISVLVSLGSVWSVFTSIGSVRIGDEVVLVPSFVQP